MQERTKGISKENFESRAQRRDRQGAWIIEADNYGIEALRTIGAQHATGSPYVYAGRDGVIRILTRLKDCKVRYRCKTEVGRRKAVERAKGCSI